MKTYITSFALTRSSLSGDYMRQCQCISLKKKKTNCFAMCRSDVKN